MSALCGMYAGAETIEKIKFGDFNSWVTRHIHESGIIGGNKRTVYEIGPYSPMGHEQCLCQSIGGGQDVKRCLSGSEKRR